ncbi:muscarinic acetylcholine receptor M3-like [Anneissia japonica]|uniref:muscarinic acetylcholine receptor M3-like n=1 Tax=Anneissia japonica TaxID=1529436 RepID=UPI0014259A00|nr:muscarinic acetylcholine receptor M3-like [Anneissia japonica]
MESSYVDNAGNGTDTSLMVSAGVIITWILAVLTVFGNSCVILAFITEKSLHMNPANFFILNLSVADFLTGAISFPLNNLWLMFGRWPFGEAVCKMWLIVDYTACAVSVCGIILISLDRYWMLKLKMKYRKFQTTKRVTVMVLTTWTICIPFYGIPTLFWAKFTGENTVDYSEDCEMESEQNLAYNAFIVCVEFLIPLPIIVYLNVVVYREIRALSRTTPDGNPSSRHSSILSIVQVGETDATISTKVDKYWGMASNQGAGPSRHRITVATLLQRHRKAAVTLAALIIAFAICWTPYNIILLWSIICDDCFNDSVWETVNYLLWSNSAINPILYALTNTKIRNTFYKFLGMKYFKRMIGLK